MWRGFVASWEWDMAVVFWVGMSSRVRGPILEGLDQHHRATRWSALLAEPL